MQGACFKANGGIILMSNLFWQQPKVFSTHKEGEAAKDYQDAHTSNTNMKRFAVADGATRSFMSAPWSKLLVDRFCHDNDSINKELLTTHNWTSWIKPIQTKWDEKIQAIVNDNPEKYGLFNRYQKKESADATFVGIQLSQINDKLLKWESMIIGDSCLFVLSNGQVTSYLLTSPVEFDYHPACFSSIGDRNNQYKPKFQNGHAEIGDTFILATDALAKWMLTQSESLGWDKVFKQLNSLKSQRDFERFVRHARQRTKDALENDDVTLMIVPTQLSQVANVNDSITILDTSSPPETPDPPQRQKSVPKRKLPRKAEGGTVAMRSTHANTKLHKRQLKQRKKSRLILLIALFTSIVLNLVFGFQIYNTRIALTPIPSRVSTPHPINTPTLNPSVTSTMMYQGLPTIVLTPTSTSIFTPLSPTISPILTLTPTVTLIPVMPKATEFLTTPVPFPVVSLMVGSNILVLPEGNHILTLEKEVAANFINNTSDQQWVEVEFTIWIAGNMAIEADDNSIYFQTMIGAYQEPVSNSTNRLGIIESGIPLPVMQIIYDEANNKWYQVLVRGFVLN